MLTIKSIFVRNMEKIALIMVMVILFLSTLIQISGAHGVTEQNARRIFSQVEQILEENSKELEQVRTQYNAMCLNDARTAAYILEYNPEAREDTDELKKIAENLEVDEIHIFDANGVIVSGTHPEYYGYSFESGEQIGFFRPLLEDKSLELVQDITPNTAERKLVQYSALWSEGGEFIVQIGMAPSNVVRATEKNELSYIFSLLRTGVGYQLYAVNPDTEKVVGSTVVSDVDKDITEIGFQAEQLKLDGTFCTKVDQVLCHCLSKRIGDNYIIWAAPVASSMQSIIINELLLLIGLIMISMILVSVVTNTMNNVPRYPHADERDSWIYEFCIGDRGSGKAEGIFEKD